MNAFFQFRGTRFFLPPPLWLLLCLSLPIMAQAQDLCLPPIGGLVAEPRMDGNPHDDVGWNGAGKLGLREGGGVNSMAGAVQYGRRNNFIYLAIDDLLAFTQSDDERHPTANDTLVLTLSTDGNHAHDWRIQIKPFIGADTGTGNVTFDTHPPQEVAYWRDSGNWNSIHPAHQGEPDPNACLPSDFPFYSNCPGLIGFDGTGSVAGGVLTNAQFVVSRNGSHWGLEMKLPYQSTNAASAASNASLYIPPSGNFSFFFDIVSTIDLHDTYVEDPWPNSTILTPPALGDRYVQNSTPDPATWGTVTLDTPSVHAACTGVKITAAGVRHTNTPGAALGSSSNVVPPAGTPASPYYLAADGVTHLTTPAECQTLADNYLWSGTQSTPTGTRSDPNWFVARVSNSGASTANAVSAKFYVAPWGIPGTVNTDWKLIGKLYDPDAPGGNDIFPTEEQNILPGGNPELQTNWQLSYKESCAYLLANSTIRAGKLAGHQCVHAELVSTDGGTVFLNKSYQFNHDFVQASTVSRTAEISVRGQGQAPSGNKQHMLLAVDKVVRHYSRDGDFYYAGTVTADCPPAYWADSSGKKPVTTLKGSTVGRDVPSVPRVECAVDPQFSEYSKIPAEYFPAGVSEGMTVIARGYLRAGTKLVFDNKEYERAKYVGGFSLDAGHLGVVDKWSLDFSGNGVGKMNNGDYVLSIPEEGSISVTTTVTAKDFTDGGGDHLLWWQWLLLILLILLILLLLWRRP